MTKKMFSISKVTWEGQEETIEALETNLVADSFCEVGKYIEENYKNFDGKFSFVDGDEAIARILVEGEGYIEIYVWPAQDWMLEENRGA